MDNPSAPHDSSHPGAFNTTHWSVIRIAQGGDTTNARTALNRLCVAYWYPIYAFIRRRGHTPEQAQDLTQAFFAELIEKRSFDAADNARGRFRSFLLASVKNFLSHERDKARAQKRGGDFTLVSWEEVQAEGRYAHEPATSVTPEQLFDRRWALTVLEQTVERLRHEYFTAGKEKVFGVLRICLSGERDGAAYAQLGRQLGISEGAARIAAHRMRTRYSELLRAEVARTVLAPADVEAELDALRAALNP